MGNQQNESYTQEAHNKRAERAFDSETTQELVQRVTDVLMDIGVHAHKHGFQYLRCAICIAYEHYSEALKGITTFLYPAVAAKFDNTTRSRVERNIRSAVEDVVMTDDNAAFKKIFHPGPRKNDTMSNGEFILTIADYLRVLDGAVTKDLTR